MNKVLLERMRSLAQRSGETIEQRVLKLQEEVGEVAGAILSSSKAPGTAYKKLDELNVAEECIDVSIVALSTLFTLLPEMETDELFDIMSGKLDKWESNLEVK